MPRNARWFAKDTITALALVSGFVTFSSTHAQSFVCNKSATTVEQGICSDKRLADLDDQLANSLRNLISAKPHMRATFLADEHRWLHERDQRCNSQIVPQSLFNCLTAEYSVRIAEIADKMQQKDKAPANTSICRSIVERYRPLAHAHPGEAPLAVLTALPHSGIRLASYSGTIWHPATDLISWAATQNPPFSLSADLLKALEFYEQTGGAGALIKAPGIDFYSLERSQGSAGCSDSRAFVVRGGIADTETPPGDSDGCQGVIYGLVDSSSVAMAQHYDWRPGMTASIDVWAWDGQDFVASCKITLTYKPQFTRRTLNNWGETCQGNDCGELRRASFKLAEAVASHAQDFKRNSLEKLTAEQKAQFETMETLFDSQPREPNSSISIPFPYRGRLYLANIGDYAIGWREFADQRVVFDEMEKGELHSRGAFSVGVRKGDLKAVSISPF
jgi:uncharacterized protein